EANIADVHDGDAPAADVARADGPAAPECVRVSPADQSPSQSSHHAAHVCHAGHAHTGWVTAVAPVAPPAPAVEAPLEMVVQTPPQFARTPTVPPPIA